ncbi:hypothetical protein QUF99_26260 [Bacillus sp. DX4.1]|uniref:hypothetical protein n=1 Tax=Bacillus sp. DX4.1 TaxID=3055867 RepID=UPI0025A17996|nr:hypothetical protein [Bacillus sp. DX4.1]MDM5190705.1 hypothetical protein [Bacillus sp. DX4.1]
MRIVKLSTAIDNEESNEITEWLEKYIFPIDFLEDCYFGVNTILYSVNLAKHHTTFYSIVHNSKPATFSPDELNTVILEGCRKTGLNEGCYYFNVNIHDNIAREVESIGTYSLKRADKSYALFPLYYLLTENRAVEGGTSYTGLIGRNKDWMLTIEFKKEIIFRVHGSKEFCDVVYHALYKI